MAIRQTRSGTESTDGPADAESAIMSARAEAGTAGSVDSEGGTASADGTASAGGTVSAGGAGDGAPENTARAVSLADEQAYVSTLYGLLDVARARCENALAGINALGAPGGTHQARLERDISASEQATRLAQLNGIERGLCFGRPDDERDLTLYIGRIGLRDDDYELKL